MKYISLVIAVLLICSCSSMSREEYIKSYEIKRSHLISPSANLVVEGGSTDSAYRTSMIGVGGAYAAIPTADKQPEYAEEQRTKYVAQLAGLLTEYGFFNDVKVVSSDSEVTSGAPVLRAKFIRSYVGQDGWPTELVVEFELTDSSLNSIFKSKYSASSGSFISGFSEGCGSCYAIDIAEKKINQSLFNGLSRVGK